MLMVMCNTNDVSCIAYTYISQTCSGSSSSGKKLSLSLSISQAPQGYYTIHTYLVPAKELLEPIKIPFTLNGQSSIFEYGIQLSSSVILEIEATNIMSGLPYHGIASHAQAFCSKQGNDRGLLTFCRPDDDDASLKKS